MGKLVFKTLSAVAFGKLYKAQGSRCVCSFSNLDSFLDSDQRILEERYDLKLTVGQVASIRHRIQNLVDDCFLIVSVAKTSENSLRDEATQHIYNRL